MKDKKKILIGFIGDGRGGGVDKFILELIEKLSLVEYKIDLFTNHKNEELLKRMNEKGIGLYQVCSAKNPIKQYIDIKTIMLKKRYDVVYFNISTAVPCSGIIAAKKVGVNNIIVHSHSSGLDEENKYIRLFMIWIHKICKNIVSAYATKCVACSQKAGEWLYTKRIVQSPKFQVLYNSVDLNDFAFKESIRQKIRNQYKIENKKVIIQVANFTYPKNHEFTKEVFKNVIKKDPSYILWLLGGDGKIEKIQKMVEQYKLEGYVFFMGKVENVIDYLQAADIFILPSLFEGYPISALEAQANGLPCLLSDNITPEVIKTASCQRIPLKEELWCKKLLSMRNDRKGSDVFFEKDTSDIYRKIEKIWN